MTGQGIDIVAAGAVSLSSPGNSAVALSSKTRIIASLSGSSSEPAAAGAVAKGLDALAVTHCGETISTVSRLLPDIAQTKEHEPTWRITE